MAFNSSGSATGRSPRNLYIKGGLSAGLRSSPRVALSAGLGYGSDRDSVTGRSRKVKTRKPPATTMYKKRTLDYTDYAHREAVNRLKFLLAESYTPITSRKSSICGSTVGGGVGGGGHHHGHHGHHGHLLHHHHHKHAAGGDDSDDTDAAGSVMVERPAISEISKYLPGGGKTAVGRYSTLRKYPNYSQPFKSYVTPAIDGDSKGIGAGVGASDPATPATAPPPEILNFIEKQEGYIEQLEKESHFCREELNNLLGKVKDVISENEVLTDQARTGLRQPSAHNNNGDHDHSDSSETNGGERALVALTPRKRSGKTPAMPLSGPNIVFESRISELEAQLSQSAIDLKRISNENEQNKRKIADGQAFGECSDVYKKQLDNMQRDKQTLEETVRKLQHTIDELKQSDANNFTRTQRTRDLADTAAFERAQSDLEIKRLKDELERQHDRVREIQHEMAKRVAEERSLAERRYNYQVDQLGGDLSSQWEASSRLQLEVERQKRMESDFRRDLAQKNAVIEDLRTELKAKTASLLSDVAQVNAEKQSMEQEITALRLQLERAERQTKVDASRLNAEVISLRQRLDRADSDLLHSRRENLRLADQISSLDKELTLGDLNRETRPSKELSKLMSDMEAKHVSTVTDLEAMIGEQRTLMDKLTAECKQLTNKLEDTTAKHKLEKDSLRQTNTDLMVRLRELWTSYKHTFETATIIKCREASMAVESDASCTMADTSEQYPATSNQQHIPQPHQNRPSTPLISPTTLHRSAEPVRLITTRPPRPPKTTMPHRRRHSNNDTRRTLPPPPPPPPSFHPKSSSSTKPSTTMTTTTSSSSNSSCSSSNTNSQTMRPNNMRATSNSTPTNSSSCMQAASSSSNRTTASTIHRHTMPSASHNTVSPSNSHSLSTTTSSRTPLINSSMEPPVAASSMTATPPPMSYHNEAPTAASAVLRSLHEQAEQNQTRAIQMWGRNIPDPPQTTASGSSNSSSLQQHQPGSNNSQNLCRNSLPRHSDLALPARWPDISSCIIHRQHPSSDSFDLVPSISISSPSLFDSGEEFGSSASSPAVTTAVQREF